MYFHVFYVALCNSTVKNVAFSLSRVGHPFPKHSFSYFCIRILACIELTKLTLSTG